MRVRSAWVIVAMAGAIGCQSHTRSEDAGPPGLVDAGPPGLVDAGPPGLVDAGPFCVLPVPERHRPTADVCDMTRPPGSPSPGLEGCTSDAECTDGANGRCSASRFGNECSYDECFSDGECGGGLCLCRGARGGVGSYGNNLCVGGNCRVDSDCGSGGFCAPSLGDCGDYGGIVGYYCRTCEDECLNDSDCVDPMQGNGYCAYNPVSARWACSYSFCAG